MIITGLSRKLSLDAKATAGKSERVAIAPDQGSVLTYEAVAALGWQKLTGDIGVESRQIEGKLDRPDHS